MHDDARALEIVYLFTRCVCMCVCVQNAMQEYKVLVSPFFFPRWTANGFLISRSFFGRFSRELSELVFEACV